MSLLLHKTILGTDYDLYIRILFLGLKIENSIEIGYCVKVHIYESQEHYDEGFRPMLRRDEDVFGDETHPFPIAYNDQETYDAFLQYLHEYLRDRVDWYSGATIVAPLGEANPRPTTVTTQVIPEESATLASVLATAPLTTKRAKKKEGKK